MNRNKKIVMAVVSTVMAGAMLVPLAACGGNTPPPGPGPEEQVVQPYGARSKTIPTTKYNATGAAADSKGVSVKDGKLAYPNTTTLNMNICDGSNKDRHIAYDSSQISSAAIMPDNYRYTAGDLKPAWWQMSQTLGVKFVDAGQNKASDVQITDPIKDSTLKNYHIITGSGAKITENSTHFLNLNEYLDYMPNYKAFLDENEIVKWSLTSDTETGAMYYAPYFDGNNDIEKYVITHREWTRAMLDGDVSGATTTWADSKKNKTDVGANQTYVTPFMGTTGSYTVDTTNPANQAQLVKVKVDYDAAHNAATDVNTALGGAINAAAGKAYTEASGNIIDLQNFAIKESAGAVTGAQLLNILRAYIDVAYTTEAGAKFYAKRSDVFNSVSAAWDVDLLVGLSRCVVTSYKLFGGKVATNATASQIYAMAGRQGTSQRRMDLVSFVGELYGVRGLEPRAADNMYIGADGSLKDSRNSAEMYDAMQRLNALTKEGLVYTGEANADKVYSSASTVLSFLIHDYSQTQTTDGFYIQGIDGLTNDNIISAGDLKFDFAPILTPVSKWDEDESGAIEADEYFRFTESWRAVKNTGFCVPKAAVENKPEELAAVLAFIDYLFSNDGQIVATYGPMSTNGNSTSKDAPANGFWYATEATGVDINTVAEKYEGSDQYHVKEANKGQYFIYENKVYESETKYLGRTIPTLTTNNINYYYGLKVNGHQLGEGKTENGGVGYIGTPARNYTNYARGIVGGALPIGNKDQGFEYQATAACGLDGSAVVSVALNNGAIKHLTQQVNSDTYWYTLVPTTLPINSTDGTTLGAQTKLMGADKAAGMFRNSSKTENGTTNVLIDIMFYGYGANKDICGDATFGKIPADAQACINKAVEYGLTERINIYIKGWNALKTHYNVG